MLSTQMNVLLWILTETKHSMLLIDDLIMRYKKTKNLPLVYLSLELSVDVTSTKVEYQMGRFLSCVCL